MCSHIASASEQQERPAFLELMTPHEALQYHGEKIVYLGVGTYTELSTDKNNGDRIGRWQYLPHFMSERITQNPEQCACLNFDYNWAEEANKGALVHIEKCLQSRNIAGIVQKHSRTMRVVGDTIESNSATEIPILQLTETYLYKVLRNGGAIIIGHFASLPAALEIIVLYNKLAKEYPNAICLMIFSHLWMQGAQFSLHEEALMGCYSYFFHRSQGIPSLLWNYWLDHQQQVTMFPWSNILASSLQSTNYPYRMIGNLWTKSWPNPTAYQSAATALGYTKEIQLNNPTFMEELVLNKTAGRFVPADYNFVIHTKNNKFAIEPTLLPTTDIEDIAAFAPFITSGQLPKAFIKAVVTDFKQYKEKILNAKITALQEQLNVIAACA